MIPPNGDIDAAARILLSSGGMWAPCFDRRVVVMVGRRYIPEIHRAVAEQRMPVLPTLEDVVAGADVEVWNMMSAALVAEDYILEPDIFGACSLVWDTNNVLTFFELHDTNGVVLRVDNR